MTRVNQAILITGRSVMRSFQSTIATVATLALMALTSTAFAQREFAETCRLMLAPDAHDVFSAQLDDVETELAARDSAGALEAYAQVFLPARADVYTPKKCAGEQAYRRYFELGNGAKVLAAEQRPDDWSMQLQAGVARGLASDSLAGLVPDDPATHLSAHRVLGVYEGLVEYERDRGQYILPEEDAQVANATGAIVALKRIALQRAVALLEREQLAFMNPDPLSADVVTVANAADSLVQTFTGVEPEAGREETRQLTYRMANSLMVFDPIENWLRAAEGLPADPIFARAESRGDEALESAQTEAYAYAVREIFYDMAIDYFEHARTDGKLQAATDEKTSIEPALAAEQAARDAAMKTATDRLRAEAQNLQRASEQTVENMRQSDEERGAFEAEADALEAELGF